MKRKAILTAAAVLLLSVLLVNSAETKKVKPTQLFMRQKAAYSQKIIEGIVLEHYDEVATNAVRMWRMSQTNAWTLLKSPDYKEMSVKFQVDTSALITAAHTSNSVEVLDAYNRVTADCVACHQHFRPEQYILKSTRAAAEASGPGNAPANMHYSTAGWR